MTVKFWQSFSKRINSTKQPTDPATAELTCRLKENTSIHDPVLLIDSRAYNYEYAYIAAFGKYYFVRDVVSVANKLVEYHLTEDPLATYKTEIGSSTFHILYASASTDIEIIDPRIAVKTSKTFQHSGGDSASKVFPSTGGTYIFAVYAGRRMPSGSSFGLATIYATENNNDMASLQGFLGDSTVLNSIETLIKGEPLHAFYSCIWVPYSISALGIGTTVSNMIIGNKSTSDVSITFEDLKVLEGNPHYTNTISVNCHLRSGYINSFRASEPYTTGDIYLPGVGMVNLNMSDWRGSSKINVQYTIECVTGNMRYYLKRDDGTVIKTFDCCVAAQCPLGQQVLNGSGIVSGVMGMTGSMAALGSGITGVGIIGLSVSAANTALAANKRDVMTSGSLGGRMVQTQPYIIHNEYSVDTENPAASSYVAERGRPYSGSAQISTMTSTAGNFIQCEGASINCSASALEKEEINNYLNNGFYYE